MSRGDKSFDGLDGKGYKTLRTYEAMKGVGEWYEWADENWDKVIEEVTINGLLLVFSGGAANIARSALSGAAKAVLLNSPRLMKALGLAVKGAEAGGKTIETIESAGVLGNNMMALGKVVGTVVEGATFDAAHRYLSTGSVHYEGLADWAKSVFWSSLTLGAFHYTGGKMKEVTELLSGAMKKMPKPIAGMFNEFDSKGNGGNSYNVRNLSHTTYG